MHEVFAHCMEASSAEAERLAKCKLVPSCSRKLMSDIAPPRLTHVLLREDVDVHDDDRLSLTVAVSRTTGSSAAPVIFGDRTTYRSQFVTGCSGFAAR